MKVVIFGKHGNLAQALQRTLTNSGDQYVFLSRTEADFLHPESLIQALDRLRPEFIINAAGYTAVDKAETERREAELINAIAPEYLARWASDQGVPLIHYSTDYVFDGKYVGEIPESAPTAPMSVYGETKLQGERAVLERHPKGGTVLRTSWIFSSTGMNFLKTIARLAAEREELRIVADQIGRPTWALVVAQATAVAFRRLCQDPSLSGLYQVSCSGQTSWHGFAVAIVEGLKARGVTLRVKSILPIKTEEYAAAATRPKNSVMQLSKFESSFDFNFEDWKHSLDLCLDEYIQTVNRPS